VATTIEVVTPLGLDNLTVPILTTLFVAAVWS
jgi:dolichol kinase